MLKFNVSIEEANKIFKALGKEPFNDVYELIGKLNQQANEQLAKDSFKVTRTKKQEPSPERSRKAE